MSSKRKVRTEPTAHSYASMMSGSFNQVTLGGERKWRENELYWFVRSISIYIDQNVRSTALTCKQLALRRGDANSFTHCIVSDSHTPASARSTTGCVWSLRKGHVYDAPSLMGSVRLRYRRNSNATCDSAPTMGSAILLIRLRPVKPLASMTPKPTPAPNATSIAVPGFCRL